MDCIFLCIQFYSFQNFSLRVIFNHGLFRSVHLNFHIFGGSLLILIVIQGEAYTLDTVECNVMTICLSYRLLKCHWCEPFEY